MGCRETETVRDRDGGDRDRKRGGKEREREEGTQNQDRVRGDKRGREGEKEGWKERKEENHLSLNISQTTFPKTSPRSQLEPCQFIAAEKSLHSLVHTTSLPRSKFPIVRTHCSNPNSPERKLGPSLTLGKFTVGTKEVAVI